MAIAPPRVRESARALAKELIWSAVRYEPGSKPSIFLFCTRRGGSTWLMETIGANRGILTLNQPFELLTPNLTPYQFSRLPKFDCGQVIRPDTDQLPAFEAYVEEVMAGRLRPNAPHRFWRPGFDLRVDRLACKTLATKTMIDWFTDRYPIDVVLLFRHPIPQALSCLRNGWGSSNKAYLRHDWFVDEVLREPALIDEVRRIDADGPPLDRFVLNWAFEHVHALRLLPDRPDWFPVSYEETVVDRSATLDRVARRLDLTDHDRMVAASRVESASSSLSTDATRRAIAAGDLEAQVSGWCSTVDDDDRRRVDALLDRFGITLYRAGSALPDWTGYRPAGA